MNTGDQGRTLALRANILSRRDHVAEADRLFEEAEHLMVRAGHPIDTVLFGLDRTLHLLRTHRPAEAMEYARRLIRLASALIDQRAAHSALIELVRLAYRGELSAQVVESTRVVIERPWLHEARFDE